MNLWKPCELSTEGSIDSAAVQERTDMKKDEKTGLWKGSPKAVPL